MNDATKAGELEIKVPASIANLGPGFDTLAVAVRLYLRLKVRTAQGQNQLRFNYIGRKLVGENYIERAFKFLARQHGVSFPSLEIDVYPDIPIRSGLGSSASATVAGLRLYEAVMGKLSPQGVLNAACALEGHPDNVAAALLGGMTASCQLPDGSTFAVPLHWPDSLKVIVLTPNMALSTSASRGVLPDRIPRPDVVFNLQRIAMMIQALQTENFTLLREAMRDRLHQPYRQRLVPGLEQILLLQDPDLLGTCLSGAGPSIVALAARNLDRIEELIRKTYDPLGIAYEIRQLTVHIEEGAANLVYSANKLCV